VVFGGREALMAEGGWLGARGTKALAQLASRG
jgi:hypothetical protein